MTRDLSLQEFDGAQISALRSIHSHSDVHTGAWTQSLTFQKVAAASFHDPNFSKTEDLKSAPNQFRISTLQESFKTNQTSSNSTHYLNFRTQASPRTKLHNVPSCYLRRFACKEDALLGLDSVRIPNLRSFRDNSELSSRVAISGKTIPK